MRRKAEEKIEEDWGDVRQNQLRKVEEKENKLCKCISPKSKESIKWKQSKWMIIIISNNFPLSAHSWQGLSGR